MSPPSFQSPDASKQPAPTGAPSGKLRILVVEDEQLVREVICMFLNEDKHEIGTAEDGGEGLEKFRTCHFDLVMTDRSMPELSGDQLAIEIKKLSPETPVILLTGFGDMMPAGQRQEGVDVVVAKPFTMETLRHAIAEASNRFPRKDAGGT